MAFAESRGISDPHLWLCCSICQQPHGRNAVSLALGARWWELLSAAVPGPELDEMDIMMNKTLAGPIYHAALTEQGRHAEAGEVKRQLQETEDALEQAQSQEVELYGNPEDPLTQFMRSHRERVELAADLEDEERFAESEPIYRRIIDEGRALLAQPGTPRDFQVGLHSIVQRASRSLGNSLACQASQGRKDVLNEGERLLREVLDDFRRVLGPAHPETLETTVTLAQCLALRGGPHASELLRECMPELRASNHPALPLAQQLLSLMHG